MNGVPQFEFHHVGISVPDLEVAARWWDDMFGFKITKRFRIEPANADVVLLSKGPLNVELFQERDAKLAVAQNAQAELIRKERELEDARRGMELTIQTKVQSELGKLREQAKQEAETEAKLPLLEKEHQISAMQQQLEERDSKLAAAQKAQAEVIRKERELDDARREMDLTVQTRVQAEVSDIRAKARQEAEAKAKLPLIEKEQQIASMQKQIEELKRKAEQGSQQAQGEAQELHLEALLRANFTRDVIEPVPKGEFGGDVLQRVMGPADQPS